jgi:hypothetical protein
MKTALLFIALFSLNTIIPAYSQDLGATFCWQYLEIYGGHSYPTNQSIVKERMPQSNSHWSVNLEWWENMVEEVDYSGMDFIALLTRGTQPGRVDLGMGDPKHIKTLVHYMKERNAKFKLGIFDDPPASWRQSRNYHLYAKDFSKYELFDCADTTNYKYIWDYNLKLAIEYIPEHMRYTIDNRMVIFFWAAKPSWMTNLQGNLSKILEHIKTQCQATFGFTPYVIIDKSWLDNDKTLNTSIVDAVHGWFSAKGGTSHTLFTYNGVKTGVCVPSFIKPSEPDNGVLYPGMGTDDQGTRLRFGLDRTVKAGARVTLVEGFTDAAEGAALWRSIDNSYYNYPNQRLNVLRSYTRNPFPDTLRVEAETCDFHYDLTPGNSGGALLYKGDLDVLRCTDTLGGWHVTHTQANEWMEWREVPLLEETRFELRYKSTAPSSVKISIDGIDLPAAGLPSTAGIWSIFNIGAISLASNGLHTVRLSIVSGSPDINYLTRIKAGAVNSVALHPGDLNDILIYPNPANDFVRIISKNQIGEIRLFSIAGGLQLRTSCENETDIQLNVSNLKPGLYFLIINNKSHKLIIN